MLNTKDIISRLKVSRMFLHRHIKDGSFPAPFYIGNRSPRWEASQIDEWVKRIQEKYVKGNE
jgi:predicted DNA-binding transcriptional regulator AlpA